MCDLGLSARRVRVHSVQGVGESSKWPAVRCRIEEEPDSQFGAALDGVLHRGACASHTHLIGPCPTVTPEQVITDKWRENEGIT